MAAQVKPLFSRLAGERGAIVHNRGHAVPDRVVSCLEQLPNPHECVFAAYVLFLNEAKNEAVLSSSSFVFLICAGKKLAGSVAGLNRPG